MTTSQERRSECPVCPDWLERCGHFGGTIIWLGKLSSPRILQVLVNHVDVDSVGFVVCQGDAIIRCGCSPEHLRLHRGEQPRQAKFSHLADAEDEFYRREAELLGRVA